MINRTFHSQRVVCVAVLAVGIASGTAFGQSSHARVSRDVADRLARHLDEPTHVIVDADQALRQRPARDRLREPLEQVLMTGDGPQRHRAS